MNGEISHGNGIKISEDENSKIGDDQQSEELEGFGYIEFYKTQMEELRAENESLKKKVFTTDEQMRRVQGDCLVLIEKLCQDVNSLRQRVKTISQSHVKSKFGYGCKEGLTCVLGRAEVGNVG